eukprot:4388488-Pleurochrysis_carterae.AAC.2
MHARTRTHARVQKRTQAFDHANADKGGNAGAEKHVAQMSSTRPIPHSKASAQISRRCTRTRIHARACTQTHMTRSNTDAHTRIHKH